MTKQQLENVVDAVIAACVKEGMTVTLYGMLQAGVELDALVEKKCYGTSSEPPNSPPRFSQSLEECEKLIRDGKLTIEKITYDPTKIIAVRYTAEGGGFSTEGRTPFEAMSRLALRQAGVVLASDPTHISAKDFLLQITPVFIEKLS